MPSSGVNGRGEHDERVAGPSDRSREFEAGQTGSPAARGALRHAGLAAILACVGVSILFVDPRGDFPLNDDWNFALATWRFAETGEFVFSRFTGMSLKLQVLWGALWTVLFGKSFEVLRASSLLLGALTAVLAHALLGRAGARPAIRILASLALFFQPLFFLHAFTFMTHIPYVFVSALALFFFYRGMQEERTGYWVLGCLVALASCMVRQTGVVNLVAGMAAVALGPKDSIRRQPFLLIAGASLGVFAVLFAFTDAFTGYPGQISIHLTLFDGGLSAMLWNLGLTSSRWVSVTLQYGWLLFLPLTLPLAGEARKFSRAEWLAFLAVFFVIVWVTNQVVVHHAIPDHWKSNVLRNFAFGPLALRDIQVFRLPFPRRLPEAAIHAGMYLAAAGGAFVLVLIVTALRRHHLEKSPRAVLVRLLTAHALAATAVLGVSALYFDRYALDALWTLPLFFAAGFVWTTPRTVAATGLLAAIAVISILGTGEYLAWNRERWNAFRDLRARGIPIEEIDGGYEINQYLIGGFHGRAQMGKEGMAVVDDRFILTFQPVRGYEVVGSYPYRTRLGWPRGTIYALRRTTGYDRHAQ